MRTYDANIQRPQRALRDKYNGLYLIDISGFLDMAGIVNWIMLKMTIITILMFEIRISLFSHLLKPQSHTVVTQLFLLPVGNNWAGVYARTGVWVGKRTP